MPIRILSAISRHGVLIWHDAPRELTPHDISVNASSLGRLWRYRQTESAGRHIIRRHLTGRDDYRQRFILSIDDGI